MSFLNQLSRIFDLFMSIVDVAALTVVVTSPQTAKVIEAFGNAFSGGLRAAMGR